MRLPRRMLVAVPVALCLPAAQAHASVSRHPCNRADYTQQCALSKLPPPSRAVRAVPFGVNQSALEQGADFSYSGLSAASARSLGFRFGISYLSYDPAKDWTQAFWDAYHADGLKTVLNWEWGCCDASSSHNKTVGEQEAGQALTEANGLGAPSSTPIYFSVDENTSWGSVANYFAGASKVLGKSRVGVYGDYNIVNGAYGAGYHWLWQTYAWSNGLWFSHDNLQQYCNCSASYDNDRALTADYGQVPRPSTKASGTANAAGGMSLVSWQWGIAGTKGTWKASRSQTIWVTANVYVGRGGAWAVKGIRRSSPPSSSASSPVSPAMRFGVHFNATAFNGGSGTTWRVSGLPGSLPTFPSGCKQLGVRVWFKLGGSDFGTWRVLGIPCVK